MPVIDQATSRRRFLQFLAASPLLAGSSAFAEGPTAGTRLPDPITWAPLNFEKLIKSPKEAINVFDFEPVCRLNVPPAHFGYMASGIDDEVTLRANREGFLKFQLRPRRLVDISKVDMSVDILGVKYASPIMLCPIGGHQGYHLDAEIGVGYFTPRISVLMSTLLTSTRRRGRSCSLRKSSRLARSVTSSSMPEAM